MAVTRSVGGDAPPSPPISCSESMWHMGSDGAAALGVWLFGDLLSLLLSGVDLCCKARAVHRARWAFGRRQSPGSQRSTSVLPAFSPQGGGRGGTVSCPDPQGASLGAAPPQGDEPGSRAQNSCLRLSPGTPKGGTRPSQHSNSSSLTGSRLSVTSNKSPSTL